MRALTAIIAITMAATSAVAAETMTYIYDANGRLVKVQRSGGNNNGVTTQYSLDLSDNRVNAWQNTGTPPTFPVQRPPAFSVVDAAVVEGGTVAFTIRRHGSTIAGYSLDYATSSGTATAGSDFTTTAATQVNFGADTYEMVINVPTIQDANAESPETFTLTLSNPCCGATIADASATGTIVDNDSANPPPVANNDTGSAWMCDSASINVIANDTDPDNDLPLTLDAIISSTNGIAGVENATNVLYSPTVAGQGSGIVTYRVRDSQGATAQGKLYVQINGEGPCP